MPAQLSKEQEERALKLHKEAIFIDGLFSCHSIGDPEFFRKYAEAGVTAANTTVTDPYDTTIEALQKLPPWYELFEKHGDNVLQVTTCKDIERAKREGKLGIIIGNQNADIIDCDINLLSVFKRLGFRVIQLSYYEQNLLGEGCGERTNCGLSNFGLAVVEELNRLKLVIDISHCGDQVRLDAIKHSKKPVIASHANTRSLNPSPRNFTDEQIKALAEKGGVIGICAYSKIAELKKDVRPTLDDYLYIVDSAVKVVGPDHVGFGIDLTPFLPEEDYQSWGSKYPEIMSKGTLKEKDVFQTPEGADLSRILGLTRGLVAMGYSDENIKKILGLNFLRVFKEVWGE